MSDPLGVPQHENPDFRIKQSLEISGGGTGIQAGRDVIYNMYEFKERIGDDVLPARALEPLEDNPLLGRDADLAALDAAFDSRRRNARAVVLYGFRALQGFGRTALALQFAGQALREGRYPGGAVYVDLAGQDPDKPVDARNALPVLLAFVGTEIAAIPVVSMQQQLAMYRLHSGEHTRSHGAMLLILDGVSNHRQVETLRPAGNHHLLLIPQRPLEPEVGNVEVTIGPLDPESCVALLRRSLDGRNPHFAGPENEYKLSRTGWIAAGLPKALELIAHHLGESSATDMPELVGGLADAIDALPATATGVSPTLVDAARLIAAYSPLGEATTAPPAELAGRAAVTRWITDDWRAGRPARWEIAGGTGTGKTSLLNALARRLRQIAGAAIILVSADELAKTLWVDASEADQDVDILPFCVATVQAIADDVARPLPAIAQDLYNLMLTAEAPEELLDGAVAVLKRAAGDGETAHRFAFLTDNIDDALLPDSCRRWLLRLATEVGCPVATSLKPASTTGMHAAVRLQLSMLGVEQLERLATGPDGTPLLTREQSRRVIELTGGLPARVAVALEPIRSRPGNVDKHLDLYEEKSLERGVQAAHLFNARQAVDEISRACVGRAEEELDLFDLMVVLRTFDATLLTALLAEHGLDERAVERLVERVCALRSVIVELDTSDRYEVHSMSVEARTSELTPGHLRRLHAHIEAVLFKMLDDFEPGDAYIEQQMGWTKFENPEWNALAVEWFFHAAMSQDAEITREMRTRMSLLYFRAMWWCGWFAPVYICDMVPAVAVRQTGRRSTADHAWARALAQVQASYPHTWDKAGASPADWQATAEGLRYLLRQLQLKPGAAEPDREVTELAVYLNAFLADCARFKPDSVIGTPKSYLDEARRLGRIVFDGEDDAWNFPWFDLFDAEAFIAAGDLRSAHRMLKSVLAYQEEDNDLRCRFVLAASQVIRSRGELMRAVTVGARAVLRGYVYNVVQETEKQAPSRYSRNLHEETVAQLAVTLNKLRADAPAQYAVAASEVAAYFEPYWRDARAEQVAAEPERWTPGAAAAIPTAELLARFVPAPPAEADIGRKDSRFALQAGEIYERMANEFAWPPSGWQPAGGGPIRRAMRLLAIRRPQPDY